MYFVTQGLVGTGLVAAADRVQQGDAVLGQDVAQPVEESGIIALADMLEHADRDDAIEGARDIAIVHEADVDLVGEALLGDAGARHLVLLLGQASRP